MSQNKKSTWTLTAINFPSSVVLFLLMASFSCAKKPETVRAAKKTESINMDPAVSTSSQAQGTQQNVQYTIVSVDRPKTTDAGYTVDFEIQTPDKLYIPVTTSFDKSGSVSQGSFQDSARGLSISIKAQCRGDGCFEYLLIVTVNRTGTVTPVYQSAAVSFKDDLKFYLVDIAQGKANFFQTLEELASYSESHNFKARNDCTDSDCPGAL